MSLKFKIVFKEAFLILSSIFLSVFILPFVLVLFVCPLYMYRRIVIFFAPIFQALFQAPLSLNDFLVVCDDIHGRPRNSCCGVIYLKGRPAFADVVRRVEKALDGVRLKEIKGSLGVLHASNIFLVTYVCMYALTYLVCEYMYV